MGFFDFIRNLRRRHQEVKVEKEREVELGERVNPELVKYQRENEETKLPTGEEEAYLRYKKQQR